MRPRTGEREMTTQPILEMRSITKEFPGVKALSNVNLTVMPGEVHAICGENGAGKSTLMKVLSGVHPTGSYEGEIVFFGEQCQFRTIRDSEHKGIVIIHQELALSPFLSIAENIFLGNERSRGGVIDWNETNRQAKELLDRVGLDSDPETRVVDIGVGRQQLVEIAKALSKDVKLLILDEPTAALNDDDSAHLLQLMRGLRDEGITMILITHKLNEIAAIADTTTVIRDGQTIETLDMHRPGGVSEDQLIALMVGRSMENRYPEHTPHIGEEVLHIEDWTVHHPIQTERKLVDNASLTVRAGEIVGIAGLMGAGRTELAMSVFGRTYGADISGNVYMHGKLVDTSTVTKAKRAGIAYVSEDRKRFGLNLIQSVKTNTVAAALEKISQRGVVASTAEDRVAEKYRQEFRIKTPSTETLTGQLSGGNQQKVAVSKWIFTEPEVLIMDEPTRGIDVGAKYEIYQIIQQLADSGKAVLVISSELPELLGICDRIYALSHGRITGYMDRKDATQEKLMALMTREKESAHQ